MWVSQTSASTAEAVLFEMIPGSDTCFNHGQAVRHSCVALGSWHRVKFRYVQMVSQCWRLGDGSSGGWFCDCKGGLTKTLKKQRWLKWVEMVRCKMWLKNDDCQFQICQLFWGSPGGVLIHSHLTNVDYDLLFLCHCIFRRFLCSYGVKCGILACASQLVPWDVSSQFVLGEKITAGAAAAAATDTTILFANFGCQPANISKIADFARQKSKETGLGVVIVAAGSVEIDLCVCVYYNIIWEESRHMSLSKLMV